MSIGAIITEAADNITFDDVYKDADDAMYHSKKNGKGQFTLRMK